MPWLYHRYRLEIGQERSLDAALELVTRHASSFKVRRLDRLRDESLVVHAPTLPSVEGCRGVEDIDLEIECRPAAGIVGRFRSVLTHLAEAERVVLCASFWDGEGQLNTDYRTDDVTLIWRRIRGLDEHVAVSLTSGVNVSATATSRCRWFTAAFACLQAHTVRLNLDGERLHAESDPPVTCQGIGDGSHPTRLELHGLHDPLHRFEAAVLSGGVRLGIPTHLRLSATLSHGDYGRVRAALNAWTVPADDAPWHVALDGGPWRLAREPAAEPVYAGQWTGRGEHQIDAMLVPGPSGAHVELLSTKRLTIPGAIDLGTLGFTLPTRSTR